MTNNELLHDLLQLIPTSKKCKHCKRPFTPSRVGRPAKFCSSGCRVAHWRAKRANGSHKVELSAPKIG